MPVYLSIPSHINFFVHDCGNVQIEPSEIKKCVFAKHWYIENLEVEEEPTTYNLGTLKILWIFQLIGTIFFLVHARCVY